MKSLYAGIAFLFSTLLTSIFISDVGCGLCGGVGYQPKFELTAVFLWFSQHKSLGPDFCSVAGCTGQAVKPIFLDLLVIGVTLSGKGIKDLKK